MRSISRRINCWPGPGSFTSNSYLPPEPVGRSPANSCVRQGLAKARQLPHTGPSLSCSPKLLHWFGTRTPEIHDDNQNARHPRRFGAAGSTLVPLSPCRPSPDTSDHLSALAEAGPVAQAAPGYDFEPADPSLQTAPVALYQIDTPKTW